MTEKKEHQRLSRIFSNIWYMVKKLWKYSPLYIVGMVFDGVILGFLGSADVVYTKKLFDAIDLGTPFWSMGGPAFWMGCMALFSTLVYAFEMFYWRHWNQYLKNRLYHNIQQELFLKAARTDLCNYDDPKYYNDFVWAMNEAESRILEITGDIGKMIHRLITVIAVIAVSFSIDVFVSIAVIIGSAITTAGWLYVNKIGLAHDMELKPIFKANGYFTRVFHLPDYAKEMRTSNASKLLKRRFIETQDQQLSINRKYGKRYVFYDIVSDSSGYFVFYGSLIYMLLRLFGRVGNPILLGSFAASVNVCWRFRWNLYDFCQKIAGLSKHSLYVEKYRDFMDREETITSGTLQAEPFRSLKLDNVSFAYESVKADEGGEKTHKEVLKNISFEIKRGEKIAFVGYNGAGKTTLTKLIMRLYDVSSGAIYYNGHDLREYDIDAYRSRIGAVFQDFKLFAASIAENVIGDGYEKSQDAEILKALDAATFGEKLKELPKGIRTHLTREYDEEGTNLSGGEAQKVAIARVFAKPYDLIIMDEPSAALDPMAEASLNKAILDYAREHTVIFISHRLSTTKIADKIYMMDDGRIIESGSHDALMQRNGKYAEMFRKQAEKYLEEV